MASFRLPNIASLRGQQLLLEYASLQAAPPPGVYVTVSPTDPTFWSGVIFVQKGPYASAILRFQVRFPPTYPDLPPLVTFGTDIFHPLLVPLTTYTFTTGSSDTDTVSATDEERLPPGGFSLRHGFPHWFGRAKRSATNSATSSRTVSGSTSTDDTGVVPGGPRVISGSSHQVSDVSATPVVARARMCPAPSGKIYSHGGVDVPVLDLLNYIRSTFDEEGVLDSIPLEAAGNPGAWHAWRSHRRSTRASDYDNTEGGQTDTWSLQSRSLKGTAQSRSPGEWNWTGVWEKRVQNGIQNSYMESVLFGNPPRNANDLVRFQKLDNDMLTKIKDEIIGPANN